MARRIIIEAVACVTKYFVAASVDRGFFLLISMGIIASRLNSRPTHISIRLVLDIVITGPKKRAGGGVGRNGERERSAGTTGTAGRAPPG